MYISQCTVPKKRLVPNNLAMHVMVMSIVRSMKTGAGKAVLFLREYLKLHVRLFRKTAWHFVSKERRGELLCLCHGPHHVQPCVSSAERCEPGI